MASNEKIASAGVYTAMPVRMIGSFFETFVTAGTWVAVTTTGLSGTSARPTPIVPTVQKFTSGSGTYLTPPGVLYLRVRAAGGGGGGGASTSPTGGSSGGTTTFGTSLITLTGGTVGGHQGAQTMAAGGTCTATGLTGVCVAGGMGTASDAEASAGGTPGGVNPFGGGGGGGIPSSGNGGTGAANTGAGGGGSGSNTTTNAPGSSGGAGGYADVIIPTPASSYP